MYSHHRECRWRCEQERWSKELEKRKENRWANSRGPRGQQSAQTAGRGVFLGPSRGVVGGEREKERQRENTTVKFWEREKICHGPSSSLLSKNG